jgi:hypothetical protein
MIDAEVLGDLRHGRALHFDRMRPKGRVQPPALNVGLDELIPRRHSPEHDSGLSPENWGEMDIREPSTNPIEQLVRGPVPELLGGIGEKKGTCPDW